MVLYRIRLEPEHHRILDDLIHRKIFKNRNEAINEGVRRLGVKHGIPLEKSLKNGWSSTKEDEAWKDL